MYCNKEGVSVVIPFYNGNRYINEAVQSVMNSLCGPYEILIVVDKLSEEPDIVHATDYLRVIYNDTGTRGAGVVRALGFNSALYRFVAFLDADDLFENTKFKVQIPYMQERSWAFSFGCWRHFPVAGKGFSNNNNFVCSLEGFLRKSFVIGCLTVVIDKSMISSVPANSLRRRNDYRMWFDVIQICSRLGYGWGHVPHLMGQHRLHSDSLTSSRLKSVYSQFVLYRDCGFSVPISMFYMMHYLRRTIGTR